MRAIAERLGRAEAASAPVIGFPGFDGDGDRKIGCDDPDCAGLFASCGNGVCDAFEDCRICPADCGAFRLCGDLVCDPGETCANCPGDCPCASAGPMFERTFMVGFAAPLLGLRGWALRAMFGGVAVGILFLIAVQLTFNSGRIVAVIDPEFALVVGIVGTLGTSR